MNRGKQDCFQNYIAVVRRNGKRSVYILHVNLRRYVKVQQYSHFLSKIGKLLPLVFLLTTFIHM